MKRLDQVSDDELVAALALWGAEGMGIRHLGLFAAGLGLHHTDESAVEQRLYDLYHRGDRVTRPNGDDHYALTWIEWGRRLEGKTAEQIAVALAGGSRR